MNEMTQNEIQLASENIKALKPGGFATSFHENEISAWNTIRLGQMKGAYLHSSFVRTGGLVAITLGMPKS